MDLIGSRGYHGIILLRNPVFHFSIFLFSSFPNTYLCARSKTVKYGKV